MSPVLENGRESSKRRPTIGLICKFGYASVEGYESVLLSGVVDAARERDVNLICFAGGQLAQDAEDDFVPQRNVVYDFALSKNIDGLIIASNTMVSHEEDIKKLRVFCDRYECPKVSIGLTIEGVPSLLVDNRTGFLELMNHLIKDHGFQKIAFIRGPEGHSEAEQRFHAYTESLKKHNLVLDPKLVLQGDFLPTSGKAAIQALIDHRGLQPNDDLDAIVVANDYMAFGALEALELRGIRVPYDVTLTGFDDIAEATVSTPPLTTIRQPIYQLGLQAVETLLLSAGGWGVVDSGKLPTQLIVRQSCGCQGPSVKLAGEDIKTSSTNSDFISVFSQRRSYILEKLENALALLMPEHDRMSTSVKLLDTFSSGLRNRQEMEFLQILDEVLRTLVEKNCDVISFNDVISVMRVEILPILNKEDTIFAENLWQQGRVMIGGMAQRVQAHQKLRTEERARALYAISRQLIMTFKVSSLMKIIAREFPAIGIEDCYIAAYKIDNKTVEHNTGSSVTTQKSLVQVMQNSIAGQSLIPSGELKWILGMVSNEAVTISDENSVFPVKDLLPNSVLQGDRRVSLMAKSLFFREQLFGIVCFGLESEAGTLIHETLRLQISSALRGASLFQEYKEAEDRIQKQLREKEVLLKEVNHRVKNNMNVIASLINLQSKRVETKEQALDAFKVSRDRIRSMAIIHEKLYKSEELTHIDIKSYIDTMVKQLINTYGAFGQVDAEVHVKSIFLDINRAIPCGLIVNEVVTNSLKYAFPEERKGRIQIDLNKNNDVLFELVIQDDGVGLPHSFVEGTSESLGMQLVRVLTEQIDGELKVDGSNGVCYQIRFPVNLT